MTVTRYCPFCATAAESDWVFCQACARRLPAATTGPLDGRDAHVADAWQRALRHMETNDLEDAERVITQLTELGCDAGDLNAMRGSMALRRARLDTARELLDAAVEESPDSPFVRLKRAEYWRAIGIASKAIEEITEGLRHCESERVREDMRRTLEKLKKESRWNFSRASPRPF